MLQTLLAAALALLPRGDVLTPASLAPGLVVPLVDPEGRVLAAHLELAGGLGPRSETYVGSLTGEPDSVVVLSTAGGALRGSVDSEAGRFRVQGPRGGPYVMASVDDTDRPGRQPVLVDLPATERAGTGRDDGSEIDLLVVFTPKARVAAGGTDAIRALVQLGVTQANVALERSLAGTRIRLVQAAEIDYEEAGDLDGDLELLQRELDGAADEVHAMRDAHGADLVQLVVDEGGGCGIAYQMTSRSAAFAPWAFSVVDLGCVDAGYGVAHELAHNLGCDHAPEDAPTGGAFDFSRGYKDFAAGFRTIMAYGPGERIGRFSSPRLRYRGQPLGTEGTDNARSIRAVRRTVAGFRDGLPRPTLASEASGGGVSFEWSIDGDDVVEWWLVLGTTRGGRDVFDSGSLGGSRRLVVPASVVRRGAHARLWYRRGELWLHEDVPLAGR